MISIYYLVEVIRNCYTSITQEETDEEAQVESQEPIKIKAD